LPALCVMNCITFAADGGSFTGTFGYVQSDVDGGVWTGVRQNGAVTVKLIPSSAVLKPGGMQAFQALVAGAYVKTITWTSTAGTTAARGAAAAGDWPHWSGSAC